MKTTVLGQSCPFLNGYKYRQIGKHDGQHDDELERFTYDQGRNPQWVSARRPASHTYSIDE